MQYTHGNVRQKFLLCYVVRHVTGFYLNGHMYNMYRLLDKNWYNLKCRPFYIVLKQIMKNLQIPSQVLLSSVRVYPG